MYDALLKRFGLIIGEIFIYNNTTYLVMESGIYKKINEFKYEIDTKLMADMITGEIVRVKKWEPSLNEKYYIYSTDCCNVISCRWLDSEMDEQRLNYGLVCKTKEEALALGKHIINYLQ